MTATKNNTKVSSEKTVLAAIKAAADSAANTRNSIHKACVLILAHSAEHGDWTKANTLIEALELKSGTHGLNGKGVIAWFVETMGLAVDAEAKAFTKGNFTKAKAAALVDDVKAKKVELPFWYNMKPPKDFEGFDADAAMISLLDKIEKMASTKNTDKAKADKIDMHVSKATMERFNAFVKSGAITLQ